jgi:hypothetical protein
MNGCSYIRPQVYVYGECMRVEVCVYICGAMYSISVHMNLCMSIYIYIYMSNIRMYVYNVYMVMYVLTYTCVCLCLGVCMCVCILSPVSKLDTDQFGVMLMLQTVMRRYMARISS